MRELFFGRGGEARRGEGWSRWVGGRGGGEAGKRGGVEFSIYDSEISKNTLFHVLQRADQYNVLTANKHKIGHNFKMG